jgi:hypothetical protein
MDGLGRNDVYAIVAAGAALSAKTIPSNKEVDDATRDPLRGGVIGTQTVGTVHAGAQSDRTETLVEAGQVGTAGAGVRSRLAEPAGARAGVAPTATHLLDTRLANTCGASCSLLYYQIH